jgi:hypothetical protein
MPVLKRLIKLLQRARIMFSMRTIKGGIEILRSGDIYFFAWRLYEILIHTPPDVKAVFSTNRTINILTTRHTIYVAYLIRDHLQAAGIESRILERLDPISVSNTLHIVICPNVFRKLPQHMIAMQMEQTTSNRWFNVRYINVLRSQSIAVLDYAGSNIGVLTDQYRIPFQKIFFTPIGHSPSFRAEFGTSCAASGRRYDLVFYGAMNDRRRRLIDILESHFKILVISECFGHELYKQLAEATAVINLHYYDPALLETTRIHECLALGLAVISEVSLNDDEYPPQPEGAISFVDFSDANTAIASIRDRLAALRQTPNVPGTAEVVLEQSAAWSRFYFFRMLVGLGMIEYSALDSLLPEQPIPRNFAAICLSLPETQQRRANAWHPPNRSFEFFDGIRHPLGWVGCALSYRFIARHALRQGIPHVLIYEDDVAPDQLDVETLATIESYLEHNEGHWDVFSGLITNLSASASISRCEVYGGLTFVHLNKMTGTVFNIYSQKALEILECWSFSDSESTLTIDRHLEARHDLQVVTVYPFVAGHKDELVSTLWGFRNSSYNDWIAASQRMLGSKLAEFTSTSQQVESTQTAAPRGLV